MQENGLQKTPASVRVAKFKSSSLSQTDFLPVQAQCVTHTHFPRSSERGSVEAWQVPEKPRLLRAAFRVLRNAAPLKPDLGMVVEGQDPPFRVLRNAAPLKPAYFGQSATRLGSFPRSSERGSVEAGVKAECCTTRCRFPRSSERGSVEAGVLALQLLGVVPLSAFFGTRLR